MCRRSAVVLRTLAADRGSHHSTRSALFVVLRNKFFLSEIDTKCSLTRLTRTTRFLHTLPNPENAQNFKNFDATEPTRACDESSFRISGFGFSLRRSTHEHNCCIFPFFTASESHSFVKCGSATTEVSACVDSFQFHAIWSLIT